MRNNFKARPTSTPSLGLNVFLNYENFGKDHFSVDKMCAKFQGQKKHKKEDILILPTCVVGRVISLHPCETLSIK